MALQLPITNNNGITANYHRIISATQTYNTTSTGIYIKMAGYVSRVYREKEITPDVNGMFPSSTAVSATSVYLPFVDGETFKLGALYTRIKAESIDFGASVDI